MPSANPNDDFLGLSKFTIEVSGDVELWVLKESGWVFPLHATPHNAVELGLKLWKVGAAVVLPVRGITVLSSVLGALTVSAAASHFLLRDGDLKRVATKAEGITPNFYYRKPDGAVSVPPRQLQGVETLPEAVTPEMNAFAKFLAGKTGLVRVGVIRTVLGMIRNYGPEWMVDHGKTLDLGSIKVDAFPYRRHWKEIFAAKYGIAWLHRLESRPGGIGKAFDELNLTPDLMAHDLIAMRDGTVGWTVEAQTCREFDQYVQPIERELRERIGPERYARQWAVRVQDSLKRITAALTGWIADAGQRGASLRTSLDGGRQVLVEDRSSVARLKKLARYDAVLAACGVDRRAPQPRPAMGGAAPIADGVVPEVPDLPRAAGDMREAGSGDDGEREI